jgi:hypothetical protein
MNDRLRDGLAAGAIAAVPSGIPSTLHALITKRPVLEATEAAGSLIAPRARSTKALVTAAIPAHFILSIGWGIALSFMLPKRRTPLWGALGGIAIAVFDLGLVGRRLQRIRDLPPAPQVMDHVAFGVIVGYALRSLRATRSLST